MWLEQQWWNPFIFIKPPPPRAFFLSIKLLRPDFPPPCFRHLCPDILNFRQCSGATCPAEQSESHRTAQCKRAGLIWLWAAEDQCGDSSFLLGRYNSGELSWDMDIYNWKQGKEKANGVLLLLLLTSLSLQKDKGQICFSLMEILSLVVVTVYMLTKSMN